MEVSPGDVVMPGDNLKDIGLLKKEGKHEKENMILGPGLRREGDKVYICKAGILKKREPAVYYVDSYQKRYRNSIIVHPSIILLSRDLENDNIFINVINNIYIQLICHHQIYP